MPYEQKDGDIKVYKNDRRTKDSHPHYRGEFLLNGQKYEIAMWDNKGTAEFMVGKIKVQEYVSPKTRDLRETQRSDSAQNTFSPKSPHAPAQGRSARPASGFAEDDSEIPFAPHQD